MVEGEGQQGGQEWHRFLQAETPRLQVPVLAFISWRASAVSSGSNTQGAPHMLDDRIPGTVFV